MNKRLGLGIVFMGAFLVALLAGTAILQVDPTRATTDNIDIAVTLDPVISITTDATGGTLSIPITPTSGGAFASSDLTVSVLTNNSTGYTLLMSSSTANTSLEHMVDTTYAIPTTTHTTSAPGTLAANTWGYSRWADGQSTTPSTFSRIPALASPDTLRTTTEVAGATDTKLTFGAVVSAAMASGSYANTVTFTATGNYAPEPPVCPVLAGKTYLQDVAAGTIARRGQDRERVILIDRRNGQNYYVQNIANADGSCLAWMETNLRYTGGEDNTYGDAKEALTLRSSGQGDNTVAEYMDPGGYGILNTSRPTNNTTFYGYLYNWCAAMGGQVNACDQTSTSGFDTTQSICPAGWRLPTGDTGGEFWALNNAVNGGSVTSDAGLRSNFLAVYAGAYSHVMHNQGIYGAYWSSTSTASSAGAVYLLQHHNSFIYPGTGGTSKATGASVRCVVGG